MNKSLWYVIAAITLLAAGYFYYATSPGKYDGFASCLTQKQVVMYGAFWCSHCQEQKSMFGKSFKYVTYIECAQKDNPNAQTPACIDAKVSSYPTWEFVDKVQQSGVISLESLSQRTGCPLPT